jgi:hypothetical protein
MKLSIAVPIYKKLPALGERLAGALSRRQLRRAAHGNAAGDREA